MANGSGGVRTATEEKGISTMLYYSFIDIKDSRRYRCILARTSISRCSMPCCDAAIAIGSCLTTCMQGIRKVPRKTRQSDFCTKSHLVAKEEKRAMACQKKLEIRQEILDAKLLSNEREELSIQQPPMIACRVKLYVTRRRCSR